MRPAVWFRNIGAAAALATPVGSAIAQGLVTAGIRGTVHGDSTDGAHVRVTRATTGFTSETTARGGRFLIQGLEPGGPYSIVIRKIGAIAARRDGVVLKLGELRDMEFMIEPAIVHIAPEVIAASRNRAHAHGGTATTLGDSLLHQLPTMNRDLYDFVRLVPQVSTKIGLSNAGFSAGGTGFRFNNFMINGVSERSLGGSVSNGFAGARSVPLEAVQEYQVLLAPYDVRYGDFAGALVNTVTRSGTNELHGSAFVFARNDRIARRGASAEAPGYDRAQYGFSLGGPILRNRLHFFIAPELQHFRFPAPGPYAGQPANSPRPVPVSDADLARVGSIMSGHGLMAGSSGPVENGHPMTNLFTRLDFALPEIRSRAVIWNNYSDSDETAFSRAPTDEFSLSTSSVTRSSRSRITSVQLHTILPRAGGGHNELLLSHRGQRLASIPPVHQPLIRISMPRVSGGRVTLITGTQENAQGTSTGSSSFAIRDNLTIPFGASHVVTLGAEAEAFRIERRGLAGSYGTWNFANPDDFEDGIADRYEASVDFGSAGIPLSGAQYAAYAGDRWDAHSRLSVTAGVRADLLAIRGSPPLNPGVDSIFDRRTDRMPERRVEFSPRVGFIWSVRGDRRRVRGGAGIFTTRFPLAWAHTAMSSYGTGTGLLRCGRAAGDAGLPPQFDPDHRNPPLACLTGASVRANPRGDVDMLDRQLRMMRVARATVAYDAVLPGEIHFTGEVLVSRFLSDFVFVNVNLKDPKPTDPRGRVMYGSIGIPGTATPDRRSGFAEVIEVRNTSRNRARQISATLEREFPGRTTGMASYTFSRVRDAQTPLRVNTNGRTAWASARVTSRRHDDFTPGISSNDLPHRFVLAGSHAFPHRRWRTDVAFYYLGESGRPFTYVAWGTQQRGDLNADGASGNDPVYVPLDVLDPSEIRLDSSDNSVAMQRTSLDERIRKSSCLRRHRGRILSRNACREPWSNTTIASVSQAIPIGKRAIVAELDVFNVLNLMNSSWGLRREAAPALLEHVGQTDQTSSSESIFRYDPPTPHWTINPVESAFQLQLALRYRF